MSVSSNHPFCYLASHCNNIIWQMPTYIITQDRSITTIGGCKDCFVSCAVSDFSHSKCTITSSTITCVVHYPNNFLLQIVCGVSDSISDWVRFQS